MMMVRLSNLKMKYCVLLMYFYVPFQVQFK